MMSNRFIGREEELNDLHSLFKKGSSSLVVVSGRRRIGKSRLIQEFAKDYAFYEFTGTPARPATTIDDQLYFFAQQFKMRTNLDEISTSSWLELFYKLNYQVKAEGKVVILFDEISWMGSQDPHFLGQLKDAWDLYFSKNPNLILVLCGSVSSWIEKNILSSSAFMGRVSHQLTLEELPLDKCSEFWADSPYTSHYDKLKLLLVTGGVPRYLKEINQTLPAEDNIQRMCFKKDALLVKEFDRIFTDLFSGRKHTYKRIVEVLATGAKGLKEICQELKINQSGYISECLDVLVKSGFVSRDYTWSIQTEKISRLSTFRLSDNYLRFYLKYIESAYIKIQQGVYKEKALSSLKGWHSIMGLQFENLVLNNRAFVYDKLDIKPVTIVNSGPFFQRQTAAQAGCQIDLLVQTELDVLYICEVKFSKHRLGMEVVEQVKKKLARLKAPKGFSFIPVLIHVNGVHDEVEDIGFFKRIIDFTEIFDNRGSFRLPNDPQNTPLVGNQLIEDGQSRTPY